MLRSLVASGTWADSFLSPTIRNLTEHTHVFDTRFSGWAKVCRPKEQSPLPQWLESVDMDLAHICRYVKQSIIDLSIAAVHRITSNCDAVPLS